MYTIGITEHVCGGVNPQRGQNNVQGACDMSALPNVFPATRKWTMPIPGQNS
jgi:predicted molibdopterin-dependent oxidoreductase YjgC